MTLADWIFIFSAAVCLVSGMLIVSRRNPVYSVVFMLPFFLAMTTLFTMLCATFLAAIQMIVYGGAILVVFLFVIMLINLRPEELKDDFDWFTTLAGAMAGFLGGAFIVFAMRSFRAGTPSSLADGFSAKLPAVDGAVFGSTEGIAMPLFTSHAIPFELASILIVVATLGAVLLAKKKV